MGKWKVVLILEPGVLGARGSAEWAEVLKYNLELKALEDEGEYRIGGGGGSKNKFYQFSYFN